MTSHQLASWPNSGLSETSTSMNERVKEKKNLDSIKLFVRYYIIAKNIISYSDL